VANFVTYLLFTPIAGIVVDRYSRKRVMLAADLGAGLVTAALFILFSTGELQIWHLYGSGLVVGVLEAFHLPAYVTAATTLLPKEQYGRAARMRSFSYSLANVAAAPVAGVLMGIIGIGGVMVVDVLTFLMVTAMLVPVTVPPPAWIEKASGELFSWKQLTYGYGYIWRRPALLGLQAALTLTNLLEAFTSFSLISPMILARTGGDEVSLGTVLASAGAGSLA
jgi:MFS family permease